MLNQKAIAQQQELLKTYRRTLAHLLEQAAAYGGVVLAPPHAANGIAEARQEIHRIKAVLREGGVHVEDEPNDEAPPQAEPVQRASGGKVEGDSITVGDISNSSGVAIGRGAQSNVRNINTAGGDYAEGNIDKRQGAFVSGGTVQGPVIGDNQGTVNVNYSYQQAAALTSALHQLRAPVNDFVGREQEIEKLVQALSKAATSGASAAISGVRGMGGIGKTELAYAVAQQLAAQFPDAQLLVELRGASANPLTPEAALQTVIRSFEREARLPDDLSQLQALYRDKLTGKHALILADDAKNAAQVRPLLPPAGCALLVTSRNRFSLPAMAALDLGALPPAEAEALLLAICPHIGAHAPRLALLCGYLPLALRVSASLLANSSRNVARYLEQLDAERLEYLSDPDTPDDPQASVEASLRAGYDALAPVAQGTLCQLSVFPTSFDLAAALAVVEVAGDAESILDLLQRRCLLDQDASTQRLNLHDLVRAFAAARLEDADAVWLRHARHYAKVAWRAGGELYNQGGSQLLAGLALFDQERIHIDVGWSWAIAHADNHSNSQLIYDYANAVLPYIGELRYHARRERIPLLEAQLAAARRLGDRRAEGNALGNLGLAYADLGDARKAIDYHEQSLTIKRELGDRRGEGNALGNLGSAYNNLGDARTAITFFEQDLEIAREIGDHRGEGAVLGNLGTAYAALGNARTAITFFEQRLGIARKMGDRRGEAITSWNLGDELAKQGFLTQAAALMQVYVDFLSEIGHPDTEKRAARVERVRQQLADGNSGVVPGEGE